MTILWSMLRHPQEPTRSSTLVQWCRRIICELSYSVGIEPVVLDAGMCERSWTLVPKKLPFEIDGCRIDEIDSFKYLGVVSRLLPNVKIKDDVVSRIDAAHLVFSSLRRCLWTRCNVSIATNIRVCCASVRSILLYGCECWALCVEDERKLEVFDYHCLMTILRVKVNDFVFSVTVLDPAPLLKMWLDTVFKDMKIVLGPSVISSRPGSENLPRPTSFTCCAIDPKSRYLCAGTDSVDDHSLSKKRQKLDGDEPRAHILVWDIRRLTEPLSVFSDIHSDCITHLSFDDTSRLLSSSEDGLVCFSDIGASPDDALLQVFNAEAPINYCGWLSPDKAADSGVYSLSNMRLKFQCWPWVPPEAEVTTTVDEVWRKLKRTYHDKTLLSAVRLPDTFARLSAEREIPEWPEYPVICMLSTADDRYNLRVSLLRPGTSTYLASHAMQSKTTDTKSDIFYAAFLDSEPRHILAVGRHSVHHLRLNISGEL
ncbi:unnamed protein product [Schistocephalus solidus]|uniref:WD_REPEATS_REGION domain-containing protein n=2 Tax=Schistocephalus solidus TaxID=70667 RepID=A0A183SGG2_SCHSO|nr:unnamed protein product [Schistocephalus solidus]